MLLDSGAPGQGVYWQGADGNYYVKAPQTNWSVINMGGALAPYSQDVINSWQQINDPAGGSKTTTTAPTGGTATTGKVLNRAGIDNTQRTIDEIPGLLRDALASEGTSYGNTVGGFDAAEKSQRGAYETGSTTNQQNYDSNFMDAIRAGIQGVHGLLSLLRGTGASGGTAEDTARDTVGGVTAGDIRAGADTRTENQGQLDSSISTFLSDLGVKRKTAADTRVNNERAIRRDSNTQLQDLFGKMAGFYGDAGDTGTASDWMNRAGALTPEIAADSRAQVSKYDQTPVIVHAPNLTAFADPTQPSVVTAPGGQVGSGIFTMNDTRKRRDPALTPVPAGA